MFDYYVYIHINPQNNEIFYVGQGRLNRKSATKNRNKYWKDYVIGMNSDFDIVVIKEGLSKEESLQLEDQIIQRFEWHYFDNLTNIKGTDREYEKLSIKVQLPDELSNLFSKASTEPNSPHFENMTYQDMVFCLNDFPLLSIVNELETSFVHLYEAFYDQIDGNDMFDEDQVFDLECVVENICEYLEKYKVADGTMLESFIKDLKLELDDVVLVVEDTYDTMIKEYALSIKKWINNCLSILSA